MGSIAHFFAFVNRVLPTILKIFEKTIEMCGKVLYNAFEKSKEKNLWQN